MILLPVFRGIDFLQLFIQPTTTPISGLNDPFKQSWKSHAESVFFCDRAGTQDCQVFVHVILNPYVEIDRTDRI
jgi:hypothetical protein